MCPFCLYGSVLWNCGIWVVYGWAYNLFGAQILGSAHNNS